MAVGSQPVPGARGNGEGLRAAGGGGDSTRQHSVRSPFPRWSQQHLAGRPGSLRGAGRVSCTGTWSSQTAPSPGRERDKEGGPATARGTRREECEVARTFGVARAERREAPAPPAHAGRARASRRNFRELGSLGVGSKG